MAVSAARVSRKGLFFSLAAILAVALVIVGIVVYRIIEPRGIDHFLALIPAAEKPCPAPQGVDAFLVLGQSQGANTGAVRTIAKSEKAYAFQNGTCWHLQDPVKGPPEKGGSIWPSFADSYGAPVVIANMAISGSSITQWTTPDQIAAVQAAIAAMRAKGYEPTLLWLNGETDAAAAMSAAEYHAELNRLADALPGMRWRITRESRCYDKQDKYQPLEMARERFVADAPSQRAIVADLDALSTAFRNADRCHLNRAGQQRFGADLARSIRAADAA